jgi:acetoacetyl-CoA synthetase
MLIVFVVEIASFEALREMTVTGAVITAPLMEWTHEAFGRKLHVGSSSGGTDVFCSCKLPLGHPLLST